MRRLGSLSLVALLIAVGPGCDQHSERSFSPTEPETQQALQIGFSAEQVPADGFSKISIQATVSAAADSRVLIFQTTLGEFVDADTGDPRKKTIEEVDVSGHAVVELRSKKDTEIGRAVVTVAAHGRNEDGSIRTEPVLTVTDFVEFTRVGPEAVELTASATSLTADGFSTVELVAKVAADAPPSFRTIVFTTDRGALVGGTTDSAGSTRRVTADSTGEARAQLTTQTTTRPGGAVVRAAIDGFSLAFREMLVDIRPVDAGGLSLASSDSSLPADGFSAVELVATLAAETPPDLRSVKFDSTGGSFVGLSASAFKTPQKDTITVTAGPDGKAAVRLRSDRNVGPVEVKASLVSQPTTFATLFIDFTAVEPTDIIKVNAASPSAPADGVTQTRITAEVKSEIAQQENKPMVKFTVNNVATFQEPDAGARALVGNLAEVTLQSGTTIGTAFITAEVQGFADQATVNLTQVFPDFITVDAGTPFELSISTDKTRNITVTLGRTPGRGSVSVNTQVDYQLIASDTGSVITDVAFRSITRSNNSGVSTATLVVDGTSFAGGVVIIRATVPGSGIAPGEDTLRLVP